MNLTQRQKVLISLIILVLLVLVWQLYLSFNHRDADQVATAVISSAPPATATKPQQDSSSSFTAEDSAYLKLVNQYHLAQMQRRLADEQAAIAKAKRDANQASGLDNNAQPNWQNNTIATLPSTTLNNYSLRYVSKQQHGWQAIIANGDKYYTVKVGDQLNNGEKILAITRQGVKLGLNGSSHWLYFSQLSQSL